MIVRMGEKNGLAFFEIGTRAIRLKDFSIGVHEREREKHHRVRTPTSNNRYLTVKDDDVCRKKKQHKQNKKKTSRYPPPVY